MNGNRDVQVTNNYETRGPIASVSWRAIFAGLFISLLTFWILFSLGMAIGGHTLDALSSDAIDGISIGTAIWVVASTIAAIFVGSFAANRITYLTNFRIGVAQALVVASLVLAAMSGYLGIGLTTVGKGTAALTKAAGRGLQGAVTRPELSGLVEESLGNVTFRSDPSVVAEGIAVRLLRGDTIAAKSYLATQTNLTTDQINQRVDSLTARFNRKMEDLKNAAGKAIAITGWTMFVTALLGALASILGALAAARVNETRGATTSQRVSRTQSAYA